MKSEQNNNKEYVVVYDLCDKAGKVLQRMPKDDILKLPVITEEEAKKKFEHNKSNATEVNNKQQDYYYINLYNEKLFAKVPSNKCSYNPRDESFTVETDKPYECGINMSYKVKTGKDLVKNSKNIDGILLEASGSSVDLFFNKEEKRFYLFSAACSPYGFNYQISLEKFLSDNDPSFNLFRSSYWENLFNSDEHDNQTCSFARLFGVANDGNNRCGVGCFSCGKVMVNNDNYDFYDRFYVDMQCATKLSLNSVSSQIGINQTTKRNKN